MPIMNVDSVELSKSGKSHWVTANGAKYMSNARGIEQVAGKTIDAVIGEYKFPDGKTCATISGFSITSAAPPGAYQSNQAPSGLNAASPTSQNSPGAALPPDRFYLSFVSNVVAHAIQSGLIKAPVEILAWAQHAKAAAVLLESSTAVQGLVDMKDDVDENGIPF